MEVRGDDAPRDAADGPFVPAQLPSYDDDEPLGFRYFRCHLEDTDNSNQKTVPLIRRLVQKHLRMSGAFKWTGRGAKCASSKAPTLIARKHASWH